MRQPVSSTRRSAPAGRTRSGAASLRALVATGLIVCLSGCGTLGSGQQLKQLQMENDRLVSEYRAQRERVAALQETNAALEARVGEAERMLAQVGKTLPSSRISRAPQRSSGSANSSTGSGSSTAPPYIPPSVPSLPESGRDNASASEVQWRPMRRQ
ncbi:MAG: hypothetical protein ACTHK7_14280 [Aureliella sp.]